MKTHRIGSVTFGSLLVVFGSLFLLHVFFPIIKYNYIFRLWPCVFILLGLEVLAGCFAGKGSKKEDREPVTFIYDKTAIVLMVLLSFFAMMMAGADVLIQHWMNSSVIYW